MVDLTDERIDWLNELWTEADFEAVGIDASEKIPEWYETRRWQVYNICMYATGKEPPYGPNKDSRFIL